MDRSGSNDDAPGGSGDRIGDGDGAPYPRDEWNRNGGGEFF